jgi:hypothetical protein
MMGMLTLLGAMWGGLARLGWELPPLSPALVAAHGPLMVAGFLGTVISLERAVALGRWWPYLAPAASGLGAVALVAGAPVPLGASIMTGGSMVLCAVFVLLFLRQRSAHMLTMGAGAAGLAAGNALWAAGWSVPQAVPWWMLFVIYTIAGERLELARLSRLSGTAYLLFATACGTLMAGVAVTTLWYGPGIRLAGAGMVGLALWLVRNDLTLRLSGPRADALRRFMARALMLGYLWLAASGFFMLVDGGVMAGPRYDAMLHTVFVGFAFTMIFAHAPVILPAVLGTPVAFRAAAYLPLILLQASLVARIGGDLWSWPALRQWGGMVNAVAVVAFVAITVVTVAAAARQTPQRQRPRATVTVAGGQPGLGASEH